MRFQFFKHNDNDSVMLIDNETQEIKFFVNDFVEPNMPGKIYGYSEIGSSEKRLFNAAVQGVKDIATEIPFNTFNTLMGAIVNKVSMAEQTVLDEIERERMKELKKDFVKSSDIKTNNA